MADSVPPPVAPPPAKKGNRTLIIVLCVLGGMLLLMGGCTVACTYFVGKKVKDVADTANSNPSFVALNLMATFHPDLEIVSKDAKTGIIVIKHKKTGETSTIDSVLYTEENIGKLIESLAAGKGVPVQKGPPKVTIVPRQTADAGTVEGFPNYVPVYPGSTKTEMKTAKDDGMLDTSFNYAATTDDQPDAVLDFYQQALEEAGFAIRRDKPGKNNYGPTGSLTALKKDPYAEVHVQAETTYDGHVSLRVMGGEKK